MNGPDRVETNDCRRGVSLAQPVWLTTMAGQSQSSGVQRSGRDQSNTKKDITLVGCLQRVDAASQERARKANANPGAASSSAGAGGTPTAAVAATWVLEGAAISTTAGSAAASGDRRSTTATDGGTHSGANYILEGRLDALPPHVGHRVEVRGILTGSTPASGSASDAPGSASDSPGSTASAGSGPRPVLASAGHVQVTSVRMISQTCNGQ